jgi:hypothetical protein
LLNVLLQLANKEWDSKQKQKQKIYCDVIAECRNSEAVVSRQLEGKRVSWIRTSNALLERAL